jgi:alpha-glucoside transport system substrate-binding protein
VKSSRFVSTAALFVAVSLTLLGCAGPSASTPAQPTQAPPAAAQPTAPSVLGATPAAPSGTSQPGGVTISSLPKVSGTVHVMGVWGADELNAFKAVAAQWEQQTGGTMQFEGTRDLTSVLTARVSGGNPPDIAILPNPALMQQYAKNGNLKPLSPALNMTQFNNDYSKDWSDLGSYNGTLYGLFVKAVSKATIWYSPDQFKANNYQVPKTWSDLINLSNQIVQLGKIPWSMGLESGSASGWPAADWVDQIVLAESGPDVYDKWVKHQIPWTDPAVKSAFQKFGQIALTNGYVPGGVQAELATNFQDATYLPYQNPPKAYMNYMQAVAQTFIAQQFPTLKPTTGYDFFDFPTITSQYAGAVTGGADMAVMFNDTPAVRSFMQFMAIGNAWQPWAKLGGYSSPNKSLDPSAYPDQVASRAAQQLTNAKIFRFGADDLLPAQLENAMWTGLLNYLRSPDQLDSILQNLESQAKTAYSQ